jgi:hypothetical protein
LERLDEPDRSRNEKRMGAIMSIKLFFQRFLLQTTLASIFLSVVLLISEKLVPGSVLPFVDVIDLLPVVFILLIFSTVL